MTDLSDAHTEQPTLEGKRVIVTGGTTGIGRAIAVLLASEGARVHICGRTAQHLDDALARIGDVGEGAGTAIDLAEKGAVGRYFGEAVGWLGGLDIAVINAAIPADALSETDMDDLEYQIATDFTAYYTSAHQAVENMGGGGDIVLIGSMSAHTLGASSTVYAGVKAGIAGFAEALRKELGTKGIKVGLLEPGLTQADFHYPDMDSEAQKEKVGEETMLRSEDIAVGVHFMLTQPRRSVIQQLTIVPRVTEE